MLYFLSSILSFGQEKFGIIKKDLQEEWKVFDNNQFRLWQEGDDVNTIYLIIDLHRYEGDQIQLESRGDFRIFMNGLLQPKQNHLVEYSIDSLAKLYDEVIITIRFAKPNELSTLKTSIISETQTALTDYNTMVRADSPMRDFVIAILLFLVLSLLAIIRFNPRLAYDYFSVV
jgi:hypothetical protein